MSVAELFDFAEQRLTFEALITPHLRHGLSAGIAFERSWIESSGQQTQQRLSPLITQANADPPPSFSVELSAEQAAALERFLSERQVGLWRQVGQTTVQELRKTLAAGIQAGETFEDLQARVTKHMRSYADWQARRVARTETTGAMNSAAQMERDEEGIEHKEWSASIDERTRASHLGADGQVVANRDAFTVGGAKLKYPGDASLGAPGSQTINCRCVSVASFDQPPRARPPKQPTPGPRYRPATSIKEAQQIAKQLDLADTISYRGLHVDVANQMNQSLHQTLKEFPDLRKNLKFIGSAQQRNRHFVDVMTERRLKELAEMGLTPTALREMEPAIRKQYRQAIGKIGRKTYAESVKATQGAGEIIGGVTINNYWGKNPKNWIASLQADTKTGFHPPGTATVKAIVDHEMAHQIDDLLHLTSAGRFHDQRLADDLHETFGPLTEEVITAELSKYAATNLAETIAEAWAEFRNSTSPRKMATMIGRHVESRRTR